MSFAKQQELAVLDTALGYLVRDRIISNDIRVSYLKQFGEDVLQQSIKASSATGRNDLAKLDTQLALLVNSFAGTAGEYYCHGLRRARAEIEAMRGG